MSYTTPAFDLLARMVTAVNELATACEKSDEFATEQGSELAALLQAQQLRDEATNFLAQVDDNDADTVSLEMSLSDWNSNEPPCEHTLRLTASEKALDIAFWPDDGGEDGPQSIIVMFEVNRGLPMLHIHGDRGQEGIAHIAALPDGRVEIVKDSTADLWRTAPSEAYPSTQALVWAPPSAEDSDT